MIIEIITSFLIVVRRFFLLIFFPYKTMRKIAEEKDYWQIIILLSLIFFYFKFAYFLRDKPHPATLTFFIFILHFFLSVFFFYLLASFSQKNLKLSSFIFTFSYSLFPTLIWFLATSLLYIILPPPRTFSLLGRAFSIFFTSFSLSLLAWKIILVYLAIRFSTKLNFYRIVYLMILYFVWFIPYSLLLYYNRIFRIPFI